MINIKKTKRTLMKNLIAVLAVLTFTAISCTEDSGTGETKNSTSNAKGLSAKLSGPTMIKLMWDSVPNATAYWIYRNNYVAAIIQATNYTDAAIGPGTKYTYAIKPVVNGVLGPKSDSVTVTTPGQPN